MGVKNKTPEQASKRLSDEWQCLKDWLRFQSDITHFDGVNIYDNVLDKMMEIEDG